MRPHPPDAPAAVCLTIDNLGEAAELGAGTWPPDVGLGRHFTVAVVHRVLELLGRHGVAATFFIEAFNTEVYPALLREIARRGHEVACHAWQHEHWSALSPRRERELLTRSTQALRRLDLHPVGFRPPGGQVTPDTPRRLVELGYRYYSPAGSRAGIADGLAVIPFEWQLVDAFYAAPALATLRERRGMPPQPQRPEAVEAEMVEALEANVRRRKTITLVFHPLLLDDPESLAALDGVLARIRALVDGRRAECLTMGALAERMLAAPDRFPAPLVDATTWASPARG